MNEAQANHYANNWLKVANKTGKIINTSPVTDETGNMMLRKAFRHGMHPIKEKGIINAENIGSA